MIGFDPDKFATRNMKLRSLEMTKPHLGMRKHAVRMTWVFLFLSVAVFFMPWQQTAVGTGRVIAFSPSERKQEINAPISGRITKWHVSEGQAIKEGDLLAELRDMDPQLIENLRNEREALTRKSAATAKAVVTAKLNLSRQEELFKRGLSARKEFEKAELDYMGYLADEAEASASLARIDVKLARQLTQTVLAPIDGTVLRIGAGQGGQIVKQGDLIATLIPDVATTTAELWLDGNDLPLIDVGRKVRLQFEGWPAVQFGGWPSVAIGSFGGEVSVIDAANSQEGKFRVFVRPEKDGEWPGREFLRQGVRVNAWVLLEQVTVGYEIWRQLNGFPPARRKAPEASSNAIANKK